MTLPKKKITFLFLQFCISVFGQHPTKRLEAIAAIEAIRFEAITYSGDHVFGVYPNREKAKEKINDYKTINKDTKHRLTYKSVYWGIVQTTKDEHVFEQFTRLCPKGYIFISKEEYNALCLMNKDKKDAAIWYYMKTKNVKEEEAKAHLAMLFSNYRKYILE